MARKVKVEEVKEVDIIGLVFSLASFVAVVTVKINSTCS